MPEFVQYFSRFQGFRGRFGGLPAWARGIVTVLALPGVILLAYGVPATVTVLVTTGLVALGFITAMVIDVRRTG